MSAAVAALRACARDRWRACLTAGVALAAALHLLQLAGAMARFGVLPNYVVLHDWIGGLGTIVQSTPSLRDILVIAADEWLLEVGYMNYDYGHGISEWSVVLMPAKAAVVAAAGWLLALNLLLLRRAATACSRPQRRAAAAAGGLGAALVGGAGLTMFWVVCCASPTWVVGLAMLGVGVTTALALEPLGPWLSWGGFALLAASLLLAGYRAGATQSHAFPAASRTA